MHGNKVKFYASACLIISYLALGLGYNSRGKLCVVDKHFVALVRKSCLFLTFVALRILRLIP